MDLYLAWSGERSKKIAEAFSHWIPLVIQQARPFFSPSDIEKGTRWESELLSKLESTDYGLLFLTPENKNAPWILFEAGALSKSLPNSRVIPMLLDIEAADISYPLAQFQMAALTETDVWKTITTLNASLHDAKVSEEVLKQSFYAFFPALQEEIDKARKAEGVAPINVELTDEHMLREILVLSRSIAESIGDLSPMHEEPSFPPFQIGEEVVHPKFGIGVVLHTYQAGVEPVIHVAFPGSIGVKILAQKYAKLTSYHGPAVEHNGASTATGDGAEQG